MGWCAHNLLYLYEDKEMISRCKKDNCQHLEKFHTPSCTWRWVIGNKRCICKRFVDRIETAIEAL